MQHAEGDLVRLPRDFRGDAGLSQHRPQFSLPRCAVFHPFHVVAIDAGVLPIFLKQRADRIVSADFLQVNHRGLHIALVDRPSVALFGKIAAGLRQQVEKWRGQVLGEQLSGQLQGAAGILNDLHRFDSGELVKEPSAAGVHQHQIALQFKQLQPGHGFCR